MLNGIIYPLRSASMSSQVNSGLSDGQSSSLRARNIEKEVEIAILAAASNTSQIVERAINGNNF